MSAYRKRIRCAGPRRSEAKALEVMWAAASSSRAHLPTLWETLNTTAEEGCGAKGLARDLLLVAFATEDEDLIEIAKRLIALRLSSDDWRARLKKRVDAMPQPYELMVGGDVLHGVIEGLSERQAAERAAAKWGGGASFGAAVQSARRMYWRRHRNK